MPPLGKLLAPDVAAKLRERLPTKKEYERERVARRRARINAEAEQQAQVAK